jgi:O-antigen ligase
MKKDLKAYLLVFILLLFSGNPLMGFLFGKFSSLVGLISILFIINSKLPFERRFIKFYFSISLSILVIFLFQFLELSFISITGAANFLAKIFMGGLVFNYLKGKFIPVLFDLLYKLCLLSIPFFIVINIGKFQIPHINITAEIHSYILYGTSFDVHWNKNAGMFWEPGAHAGILTLCLALNFNRLGLIWHQERFKLFIIFIVLISTQSTTGYLSGFVIILFYLINATKRHITILFLPLVIGLGLYFYNNTEFLKEKLETQYESSTDQNVGEFSNSRFGSLVFDWYYIKKHPIIGNGLHEKTRYADHQYLFDGSNGDAIGSGNGFSNYLASMGLLFISGYFLLLYNAAKMYDKKYSFLLLLVVLMNLQGENWFNYPIYLCLPFLALSSINFNLHNKLYSTLKVNRELLLP